jgi:hypothetical protein
MLAGRGAWVLALRDHRNVQICPLYQNLPAPTVGSGGITLYPALVARPSAVPPMGTSLPPTGHLPCTQRSSVVR